MGISICDSGSESMERLDAVFCAAAKSENPKAIKAKTSFMVDALIKYKTLWVKKSFRIGAGHQAEQL